MKILRLFPVLFIWFSVSTHASDQSSTTSWVESDAAVVSLLEYPDAVESIYRDNHNQLIWIDSAAVEKFEQQLDIIRRAGISPLFDRRLGYLQTYRRSSDWFEYDLMATDTLLMYLSYTEQAHEIGQEWFFQGNKLTGGLPLPSENALLNLKMAVSSNGISELIQSYTPSDPSYAPLMNAYNELLGKESDVIPRYEQEGLKRPGDTLSDRDSLVQRLALVDLDVSDVSDDVTYYDDSLVKVVKRFQAMHGLKTDGIIGPNTLKWVNLSVSSRLSLLALNTERIRLWSKIEDTVIVVNIPGFELKYWYLGKPVFEAKVVVGRVSRKTPLMTTNMDSVILNPTWNVPRKIMIKDLLPMAIRDPSYFSRHNIDIIKSWTSNQVMNPETIDWTTVNPRTFPYRLRQQSGVHNALGLYKFNTPNNRSIYLHDTPSKHLFESPSRAFSSGCIRVQDASLFASKILETQGIDESRLNNNQNVTNKSIGLKRRIPVHIIYQTVWYENGSLQYRDDIYRFDDKSWRYG